jgi:hypothetical protein
MLPDNDRIAALERDVAELKLALETQRGLDTLEENFTVTMQAMDARLAQLAQSREGDDPATLREVLPTVNAFLAEQTTCLRASAAADDSLPARMEAMEKLTETLARGVSAALREAGAGVRPRHEHGS